MRPFAILPIVAFALLPGCVVGTIADVATAPVRVGSKAVDLATTSQSEADEKRGRAIRKREEELGRLERRYSRHARECENGRREACEAARDEYEQIEELRAAWPGHRY